MNQRIRRKPAFPILALALLGWAIPVLAEAHAHLKSAEPADGGTVPTAPGELVLHFTEGVEPALSRVTITGPDGKAITTTLKVDSADPSTLHVIPVGALAKGRQTVAWKLVSADTHRVEGGMSFSIGTASALHQGPIRISGAFARATAPHQPTAAVYFSIDNQSDAPDRLLSATTDAAASATLHRSADAGDGVVTMRAVEDGLTVPAKGQAVLAPSGYHLMLGGLKAPLKAGQTIHLTLTFASAGQLALDVPVLSMGAAMPDMPDMPAAAAP